MTFVSSGNLVTDKREINTSDDWDTQSGWEGFQESNGIVIENGVLRLATVIPDVGDLHAHYDAAQLSLSDTDPVTTWPDESENGHDLTSADAADPTYVADALNGNPAVEFSGDEILQATFSAISQPVHYFLVARRDTHSSQSIHRFYTGADQDLNNRHIFQAQDDSAFQIYAGNFVDGATRDTDAHYHSHLFDGGDSVMRMDGMQVGSGNAGSNTLEGLTVGGQADGSDGFHLDGQVMELLVYTADKTSSVAEIESYLDDKWFTSNGGSSIGTYSDGDTHGTGEDPAFIGATLVSDGRVVLSPWDSDNIGLYDPGTDTYSDGPVHGESAGAFQDGILDGNNRVIMVPYNSSSVGIFDPSDDSYTSGPSHGQGSGAYQDGVLMDDGRIVFAPMGATAVGLFDPTDDSFSTGPSVGSGGGKWSGAAQVSDGRVIMAPRSESEVGIFDPSDDSWSTGPDTEHATSVGYQDALLSDDGRVVFVPTRADKVGVFDPSDDSFSETAAHGEGGADAFETGLKISDGRMVFTPATSANVGLYDPSDDTYTSGPSHGMGTGSIWFQGETELGDGTVVFSPRSSSTIGLWSP